MYIKNEDFEYLKNLQNGLSEDAKKIFMSALLKTGGERVGEEVKKIKVVGDEIYDQRGVDQKEFITRTMIKKAYKQVKEGK